MGRQGPVYPQQQRLCQVQLGSSSSAKSSFSPCAVRKDPVLGKGRASPLASIAPKLGQRLQLRPQPLHRVLILAHLHSAAFSFMCCSDLNSLGAQWFSIT